ncbi:hypothetical protein U8527_10295 [Kordia algicida OT-1]|uniref:Uncharacterized protein n=1 Tax=Kordia algicida OT-1 TaxID=391587 RepID=A9DW10_9FLAO|nr:hypothetical protein [Kordia algicida]EDP96494.1 hypothetical protein KAOT1_03757 [Kordia algicida OT-1]
MYHSEDYKSLKKRMLELFDNPTTVVADRSGRSQPTVTKFFKQVSIRHSSWLSIYEACIELVEEQETRLKQLYEKSSKLIKKEDSVHSKEQ